MTTYTQDRFSLRSWQDLTQTSGSGYTVSLIFLKNFGLKTGGFGAAGDDGFHEILRHLSIALNIISWHETGKFLLSPLSKKSKKSNSIIGERSIFRVPMVQDYSAIRDLGQNVCTAANNVPKAQCVSIWGRTGQTITCSPSFWRC